MKQSRAEIGTKCHRTWQEAEVHRNNMTGVFTHLSKYARPSVSNIAREVTAQASEAKDLSRFTKLYDNTLMQAVAQHAAGIKAWMSPANSSWFRGDVPDGLPDNNNTRSWYAKCSQIMERQISLSNFHAEDFEAVTDGAALGTRMLLINEAPAKFGKPFLCQRWEPDTFTMTEDEEGFINAVYMQKSFTAAQAVAKFGREMLPEAVAKRFQTKPEDQTKDLYILCVYEREQDEYDSSLIGPENMPVASNWIHEASKQVVKMGGYDELPIIGSRHLKWGGTPFGLPPAIYALADARQLNRLQMSLDLLADVAANPRLLIPEEMEGNVSLMPGGPTFYTDPNRLPRVWGNEGSYQEGEARVKMRRLDIEMALNLDVFRTFRRITKEITATEAMEIRQEAIDLFSPVFSLMSTEHYERCLARIFNILFRAGFFPDPPKDVIIPISRTEATVMPPKIMFTSRIALAITNRHKAAIQESLQRRVELSNVIGEKAFIDIKIPEALKHIDRGNGIPEELFRTDKEVQALEQAIQERDAQRAQLEAAETAASAAGKMKGSKMEDAVAQQLT